MKVAGSVQALPFCGQLIEIPLLAGADEAFRGGFQVVPAKADAFSFLGVDGPVAGRRRDGFEQVGELLDDRIGGRANVAVAFIG